MSAITISRSGKDTVVRATSDSAGDVMEVATWLSGGAQIRAAIGALTALSLDAPMLMARMQAAGIELQLESRRLTDDAHAADSYGSMLLESQVFSISGAHFGRDLRAFVNDAKDLANQWKWLARAGGYVKHGTFWEHAKNWKVLGDYNNAGVILGHVATTWGGKALGGPAGDGISDAGDAGFAGYGLAFAIRNGKNAPRLAKFVGGKALGPLAIGAGVLDFYDLATSDWRERRLGDSEGHSQATRNILFGAKAASATSSVLLGVAPFTGPAAPFVAGAGFVLMGGAAVVQGSVAAGDWLKHHPEVGQTVDQVAHRTKDVVSDVADNAAKAIGSTATNAWHSITRPTLPHPW